MTQFVSIFIVNRK